VKIKLDVKKSIFTAPFFKYDFDLSYCNQGQDLTITDNLEDLPKTPFIFFDDRECASLKSREVFKLDNLLGVAKFNKYDSLNTYNSPVEGVHSSIHEALIFDSDKDFFKGDLKSLPPLSQSDLDKIFISWSYPLFHERVENMSLSSATKDIDCFFGGSVGFKSLPLTYHRIKAATAVQNLRFSKVCYAYWTPCSKHKDKFSNFSSFQNRPCSKSYLSFLRRSKIAISPWGNGESCFRDFEAALSGCVIIKPESSHTSSYPDLDYVSCSLDFSDLGEKVEFILDNWKKFNEVIFKNIDIIKSAKANMFERFNLLIRENFEN
jgi:hypothetical protein